MIKRVISFVLLLCLISITAMAVPPEGMPQGAPPNMPEWMPRGEMPQGAPPNMPEGMPQGEMPRGEMPQGAPPEMQGEMPQGVVAEEVPAQNGEVPMQMPWGNRDMQNTETVQETGIKGFLKTYATPVISVILLILAFIFVVFYKRKRY